MAEYDPPIFDVPVFNPAYFINEDEITKSYLRNNFLEYPIGQGLQSLPDLRVENQNIHLGSFAGLASQGNSGVAIGNFAGYDTQAGGAVAIGTQAGQNSQGANSVAIGAYAGYSGGNIGANSVAIGNSSRSSGVNSIALGNSATTSTFDNAVAIGDGATATDNNEIKLGSIASFNGSVANGMYFGNVGIAPLDEMGLQHINLSKNGTNYALSQTDFGNTRINGVGSIGFRINNAGRAYITNCLHIQTDGISYDGTSIPNTGNNMIGFRWKASTLQIMGAVDNVLNGVAVNVSDRRMKTNIVDYTDGLTGIMKLKPKQYDILKIDVGNCDFTGDNCIIRDMCGNTIEYDCEGNCCDDTEISGEKITGLILDEVRPIYPEVCIGGDDNSIGTLNYAGLVPMLIKAVQEQQEQIESLKIEIEKLKIST